jgi:hypothetical protein
MSPSVAARALLRLGAKVVLASSLSNTPRDRNSLGMINRGDIILLGISAGVTGGITGGLVLGIGLGLVVAGANIGWLLLIVGGPASGLIGWIMARKLARRL